MGRAATTVARTATSLAIAPRNPMVRRFATSAPALDIFRLNAPSRVSVAPSGVKREGLFSGSFAVVCDLSIVCPTTA